LKIKKGSDFMSFKVLDFKLRDKDIDKSDIKREKHRKILENKKLDYILKLDKMRLKDELKIIKIDKDNEFKTNEVKAKCNINTLALKAGYTLGKVCLILTFISCLLTFGGNISTFICNIPLMSGENKTDYLFTWTKVLETTSVSNNVSKDVVQILRFNLITTMIYIPFLIGMQSILYQISLTIYIIKTKFNQYYKYALILQYSMLFYSVYSNYVFISYYVRPNGIIDRIMCLIPSLLLDISGIFFLSLSMRMKTLNYDSEEIDKQDNLIISVLNVIDSIRNRKKDNLKTDKNITEKDDIDNLDLDKNLDEKIFKNDILENENDNLKADEKEEDLKELKLINFQMEKYLKNDEKKNDVFLERVDELNKKADIKEDKILVKNDKENTFEKTDIKVKKSVNKKVDKAKNAEEKKVRNFIEKLILKGQEKIIVNELLEKCKIDKNKWQIIRDKLISEDILYMVGKSTYITVNEDSNVMEG